MTPRRAKPSPKKRPTEGPNAPWRIHFFQRHRDDDSARTVPAREFLDRCPTGVAADIIATVKAVAEAPPPRFAGGGQWQVMHGSMKGFHEVRVTGPGRRRYRLFCILERNAPGLGGEPMLGALLVFPRYKFVALMGSGRPQSLRPLVMLLAARAKAAAVPVADHPFGLELALNRQLSQVVHRYPVDR